MSNWIKDSFDYHHFHRELNGLTDFLDKISHQKNNNKLIPLFGGDWSSPNSLKPYELSLDDLRGWRMKF